jgi:hypothetical protein
MKMYRVYVKSWETEVGAENEDEAIAEAAFQYDQAESVDGIDHDFHVQEIVVKRKAR